MSQSTYIAGVLIIAFILFLSAQDRLKVYGAALFGPSPAASGGGGSGGSSLAGLASTAKTAIDVAGAVAAF